MEFMMRSELNKCYSDFFRESGKYDFIVDITFKYTVSDYIGRKNLKNLKDWLNRNQIYFDGIVVMEKNNYNLHYHSVIEILDRDRSLDEISNMIFKYIRNWGSCKVRKFDIEKGDYSGYIGKRLIDNDFNYELWKLI